MPLKNTADVTWYGYLADGLAGSTESFFQHFQAEFKGRQMPQVKASLATVSMWWRKDSRCVDLTSSIDGTVQCTVHFMDYGTGLFVGVAHMAIFSLGNYYKRMAASAFLESVDRCVAEALAKTMTELGVSDKAITQLGVSGKLGA